MSMHTRVAAATVLCLAASLARAGVISPVDPWTVGTGIECEFGSIQSALDAAAATPGPQTIRVTRLLTYSNQELLVTDSGDVTLEGGYAGCFLPRDTEPTVLDGSSAQSVIRVLGNGNVTRSRFDISGGGGSVPPGGGARRGGGVLQAGGGTLLLSEVWLHGNAATAAAVVGTGNLHLRDSEVTGNTSNGGGVVADTAGSLRIDTSVVSDNGIIGVRVVSGDATLVGVQVRGNGTANIDVEGDGNVAILDSIVERGSRGIHYGGSGRLDLDTVTISGHATTSVPCSGFGGMAITGSGETVLRDVDIVGNCADRGGGMFIGGTGSTRLVRTRIADNRAGQGGGIAIVGVSQEERPSVRFADGVVVEQNAPADPAFAGSGGGVYLEHAELDATQAPGHAIRANVAREGGGLYLMNSTVRIGSGQPGGSIADNRGEFGGGGMYLAGDSTAILYTTDPDIPAGLSGNATGGTALGGGISAYPYDGAAKIFVFDARIEDNVASVGGGVSIVAFGETSAGVFCMGSARRPTACADLGGPLPADARPCRDSGQCNVLQGNRGEGLFGGAALFRGAGDGAGAIPMRVVAARLIGNVGRSAINSMPADATSPAPDGAIEILDSILAGNTATNALLDSAPPGVVNFPPDAAFAMGPVRIERSTIAGNSIGTDYIIGKRLDLRVHESIVYQPFLSVHAGNAAGIDARSVIVENGAGLPVRADIVFADPLLTDAANGDVRPLPGSPALDFSNLGSGGFDVDAIPRGQDAPGAPTRFGLRDLGAHELGAARLFADDFEGN